MTASSPQELVEHALAASTSDHCVALVRDSTSANLRWANNTLTTNGVMHTVTVTVVAFHGTGHGTAVGSVSASASSTGQVDRIVEAADAAARAGSDAEDAAELPAGEAAADWFEPPAETSIDVYGEFAPALGDAFGRATAEQRILYGFVDHDVTTTYLGTSTGVRAAARAADRTLRLHRQAHRPVHQRVGRRCHPRLLRRRRARHGRRARAAARLGLPPGRPARRTLRHGAPADGGLGPDDLRVLDRGRPRRPRRPDRLLPAGRRHPDRRAAHRPAAADVLRPGLPGPPGRALRQRLLQQRHRERLRQRPAPDPDRLDQGRHADRPAPEQVLRRAHGAAGDAVRRQPGRLGGRRDRQHPRTWSPASSAACW